MTQGSAPRRELGWIHATGIVVGAIIGVGIFLTPSKVAAIAGSPGAALLLWALGGLIALTGALSLAEVGARFPESGGQILALRKLLGPLPAFLYGWCLLTAIQTGVLVLICLFGADYLGAALGVQWPAGTASLVASLFIVSLTAANLLGVRQGAWVQTATSAFKLLTLAAITLLGAWVAARGGGEPLPGGAAAATGEGGAAAQLPWIAGMAAVLFSYGGFHQLTWVGGEVRNPEKVVPGAIVTGMLIVIAAYLAANAAYFALLPFEQVTGTATLAADAIGSVFPEWGRRLTAAALCVSAYGIANTSFLTAPRIYYSLAREKLFPRIFGDLDPSRGVPRVAILVQSALALLLLWIAGENSTNLLVNGVVFVDWIFHVLACAGLILARRRPGDVPPRYRTPGAPWTPLIFIVCTLLALGATFLDPEVRRSSLLGVAWVLVGAVLFWLARRRRRS